MKKITLAMIIFLSFLVFQTNFSIIKAYEEGTFIIINKSNNKLAHYKEGQLIKVYSVATGRGPSMTPEGTFKIVNKIKNRPYYKENIPGGHPNNPLGDRWLGLNARGTWGTTYAIHGNNNPNSIGTYASAGCVRMYDEEVRELFNRVAKNTTVIITTSNKPFEQIAKDNKLYVGPKIESYEKVITLVQKEELYELPEEDKKTNERLEKTDYKANGKAKDWLRIETEDGLKWIKPNKYIEGKVEKFERTIYLFEETVSHNVLGSSVVVVKLKPNKYQTIEKIGDWYKIETKYGLKWVYVESATLGKSIEEDRNIEVLDLTPKYVHPLFKVKNNIDTEDDLIYDIFYLGFKRVKYLEMLRMFSKE